MSVDDRSGFDPLDHIDSTDFKESLDPIKRLIESLTAKDPAITELMKDLRNAVDILEIETGAVVAVVEPTSNGS